MPFSQSVDRISSQQHRKGHVLPDAGRYAIQRAGGRERNPVCLLPCHSHCRSPVPQSHDGQVVPLNELETAGLIMRVRQGVGEPNRIYVLIPGKGGRCPLPDTSKLEKLNRELGKSEKKLRKAINDERHCSTS